jgi:hypothetical protein
LDFDHQYFEIVVLFIIEAGYREHRHTNISRNIEKVLHVAKKTWVQKALLHPAEDG